MTTPRPQTLFHYTSAQGLLGILKPCGNSLTDELSGRADQGSFSLWATDSRFLNDRSELVHAAAVIADKVAEVLHGNNVDHYVEQMRRADFSTDEFGVHGMVQPTYVTCFSDAPDQLSQWRGYGGGGYAIEFYTDALDLMLIPFADGTDGPMMGTHVSVEQVVYELTDDEISKSAERIVAAFGTPTPAGLMAAAANEAARFKHSSFREEREWRRRISRPSAVLSKDFRTTPDGLIVPYITTLSGHPKEIQPIKAIWVGPSENPNQRVQAVEAVLEQHRVRYPVEVSATPFRG